MKIARSYGVAYPAGHDGAAQNGYWADAPGGYMNIAAAYRRFAAQSTAALHLIGIVLEN
jgi:hypothetical protein